MISGEFFWTAITTAIFIALLIILQIVTAPFGNMLITGSIVNLLLIVSVMTCGLSSGIIVSLFSPIMAKFFGIGSLWSIIPFIVLGNMALNVIWYFIGQKTKLKQFTAYTIALLVAAAAKFIVLYFGIVKLTVPILLKLPERQAVLISGMFSFPQLITAVIGGVMAIILLPMLQRGIRRC